MEPEKTYQWKIAEVAEEAPGVRSMFLQCSEERPTFIAGQYVTIKLPGLNPAEGKAYSIASIPNEPLLRITVRTIGTFSTALNNLVPGSTVVTSAPYGYFYPEADDATPLVLIAGGIGITPCFSILKDLLAKKDERQIHLLYSNQKEQDIVFASELAILCDANDNFSVTHFITREMPRAAGRLGGRLSGPRILEQTAPLPNPEFFLCGSIQFARDLWTDLRKNGVAPERIFTEGFF